MISGTAGYHTSLPTAVLFCVCQNDIVEVLLYEDASVICVGTDSSSLVSAEITSYSV